MHDLNSQIVLLAFLKDGRQEGLMHDLNPQIVLLSILKRWQTRRPNA